MRVFELLWPRWSKYDRSERLRSLRVAWPIAAMVGALDVLHRPTLTVAAIWAAWVFSLVALVPVVRRGSIGLAQLASFGGNIFPSFALSALATVTPGDHGFIALIALAAVPMLNSLFGVIDPGGPLVSGTLALVLGLPIVRSHFGSMRDGSWGWALAVTVITLVAISQCMARRRQRDAEARADRERVAALEALTESRLAHVDREALTSLGVLADEIAHEVNSPLAAVKASLEYVRHNLPFSTDGDFGEALDDGLIGVERIRVIVARLQSLHHGIAGRQHLRPLKEVAADAIRIAEPWLSDSFQVICEVKEGITAEAHWALIVEIVACLLLQALSRPKEANRTLILRMEKTSSECLIVQVDTALPFASEHFDQAGNGIAICSEYARRLGGSLVFLALPGGGTRYALEIPLDAADRRVEKTAS